MEIKNKLLMTLLLIFAFEVIPKLSNANSIYAMRIDSEISSFSYFPPILPPGVDTPENNYQISGSFNLIIDNTTYSKTIIKFTPLSIETSVEPYGDFHFPTYPGYMEINIFNGTDDPCNFFALPGTCSSMGNFGFYSGRFDGVNLSLSGSAPIDSYSSYMFSIKATAVPLPSSLILLGSQVVIYGPVWWFRKKRKSIASIRPFSPNAAKR